MDVINILLVHKVLPFGSMLDVINDVDILLSPIVEHADDTTADEAGSACDYDSHMEPLDV